MYCSACGSPADGRYPSCAWCGFAPAPRGAGVVALAVDLACCGAVFLAGLVVTAVIATGRGAHGLHAATVRLGWLHLLLAAAVLIAYALGAQLSGGRTLGRMLVGRAARGSGTARLFVPVVVTTAVLATMAGITAPVHAEAGSTWGPSGGSPERSATTDGRTQAIGLDTLLNASSNSRTNLRAALNDAERCVNGASAAETLRRVTDERSGQLARARELPVDLIAGGAAIRIQLVAALTHSVAADEAFTAWARNVAAGRCGHDANYAEAGRASAAATTAKRAFCTAWNPVAAGYGLPTRVEADV